MELIKNNQILSGLITLVLFALLSWIWKLIHDRIDSRKIYKFLQQSLEIGKYTFRSEPAIAAATNLTKERVNDLCAKCKAIVGSQTDKNSWRLK